MDLKDKSPGHISEGGLLGIVGWNNPECERR